jgi:hypothetical protein
MQEGEDVQHLALNWDESEIRRNAALLQQLYHDQGCATAHPRLLAVLGLTQHAAGASGASRAACTSNAVGGAAAVGAPGAPPATTSIALPCHMGRLERSVQESNMLYQDIIALKSQIQDIQHGHQHVLSLGPAKQGLEEVELLLDQAQQQHPSGYLRQKKPKSAASDSDDDWGRHLEPKQRKGRGRPLKASGR